MNALSLNNVWKIYDGNIVAVRDVSFVGKKGEFLALLGPSGCGKSTTMRMIAGLEDITTGTIMFDDTVINDIKPAHRNVALSFESYALYSTLNVRGNIEFPLRSRKVSKGEIQSRTEKIAQVFEITDLLDRMPSELSGGQAQRVSLARALVRSPSVLLLDEPLSHLDYQLRTTMRMRIRHMHDTIGATTIYVTHDQEEAVALADRIIVMNHAVVQQIGDVHTLWHHPVNDFVAGFLGDPAMNFIWGACVKGHLNTDAGILDVAPYCSDVLNGTVKIGFRPEYVQLKKANNTAPKGVLPKGALYGVVLLNEFQGERCIITVKTPTSTVKIVEDSNSMWQSNDRVSIHPDITKIHMFDINTGYAIRWQK